MCREGYPWPFLGGQEMDRNIIGTRKGLHLTKYTENLSSIIVKSHTGNYLIQGVSCSICRDQGSWELVSKGMALLCRSGHCHRWFPMVAQSACLEAMLAIQISMGDVNFFVYWQIYHLGTGLTSCNRKPVLHWYK